jgi:hypothetical protein
MRHEESANCQPDYQSPGSKTPRQLSQPGGADKGRSKRRAALLSVYHHAYERGGAARFLLPERLRPMQLENAAGAVDVLDAQEQQLALAKLVAVVGLETGNRGIRLGNRHGLGALTKRLFEKVSNLPIESLSAAFFDQLGNALLPLDPKKLNLLLDSQAYSAAVHTALLTTAPDTGPACTCEETRRDVDFDVDTLVSKATVEAYVTRDLNELAVVMDPVSWAKLGPDYFAASYKVKTDINGEVQYVDGLPQEDAHTPGESWNGILYEVFQWNWNEAMLCQFRNLLNIDFQVTDSGISMQYSLSDSLDSLVGLDVQGGGIDVDSGQSGACFDPTVQKFFVTATKSLRFTDRTPGNVGLEEPFDLGQALNYTAPPVLEVFLDKAVTIGVCAKLP